MSRDMHEITVTPTRPNRLRQTGRAAAGLALLGTMSGSAFYLYHNHHDPSLTEPTSPIAETDASSVSAGNEALGYDDYSASLGLSNGSRAT